MVFLLRLAFLESKTRLDGRWKAFPPRMVGVYGKRPSFTGNRKTDATADAAFYGTRGYHGDTNIVWIDWDYDAKPQKAKNL